MKQYLLKMSGVAAILLFFMAPGFAQQSRTREHRDTLMNHSDQVVILKFKDKKNSKVSVEIKDGEVLVDGKPISDFKSEDLSVSRQKVNGNAHVYAYSNRDGFTTLETMPHGGMTLAPASPFRSYSYDGGDLNDLFDSEEGSSKHAFLGVTTVRNKEGGPIGAKISTVNDGSAAEKAGLKEDDLITKVDDKPIEGPESLTKAIRSYKPEDKVTITISRDGKEQKVTATLGKTMNTYNFNYNNNSFGMGQLGSWNVGGQPRLGIRAQDTEDGKGVKVLDVDDESVAEKAGIKEGDIITRFDGKEVNSAGDLATNARESKSKTTFKVDLLRDGKAQTVEIKIPRKLKTANL